MVGTCEGEASASLERGTIQTRMTSSDERKARGANRLSETLGSIVGAGTGGVDAVLIGDDLPELGTDLVTALAFLDVNELALRGEGR